MANGIVTSKLKRVRIAQEPSGAFSTAIASASFLDLPCTSEMMWVPDIKMLDPQKIVQYKHDKSEMITGPESATVTFKVPLGLTGTLANATTAAATKTTSATNLLLHTIFGGGFVGGAAGAVASGGGTASVFNARSAAGAARFNVGGPIGLLNAAGVMQIRTVLLTSGQAITVNQAFDAAPASNAVLYNGTSFYPDGIINVGSEVALQMLVNGAENDDMWRLSGGQAESVGIETIMGELAPMLSVTLKFAKWEQGTAAAIGIASYVAHNPQAFIAGELLVQTAGTATKGLVQSHAWEWTINMKHVPVSSPDGTNTVFKWIMDHGSPFATGSFSEYFQNDTRIDEWRAKTRKHIQLQVGMTSSGGWLITVPYAQITKVSSPGDTGAALSGVKTEWEAHSYTSAAFSGGGTADQRYAPLALHCIG